MNPNYTMNLFKKNLPPKADAIPYYHKEHGKERIDNYYWLKDLKNPKVIDYLRKENRYYDKETKKTDDFKKKLYEEMRSRIKEEDTSVPYFVNGYWYFTRYEIGKEYPIYFRKKETLDSAEEILFDCNLMAKGHEYFNLTGINVSPDNKKVAYAIDILSRRKYTIYVKDLTTGKNLKTKLINTTGSSVWDSENRFLFYTKKNKKTLRSEIVLRYDTIKNIEEKIFHETDETFSVYVSLSKSRKYIFISSYSTLTSEHRFIRSNKPFDKFKIVESRTKGLEYDILHFGDFFYIHTNKDDANNFKLMRTLISAPSKKNWVDFIPHRKDVLLEDFEPFEKYFIITERKQGLKRIRIISWDGVTDYYIQLKGETYSINMGYNPEFKTNLVRYHFTSLTIPFSVIEFNMESKESQILKKQEVLDDSYDENNYTSKRLWAKSRDGLRIPISIVYHKKTKLNLKTPILQYAYGSYGMTVDPSFSSNRLSLLDRGFVFAIIHVRGGEYLGRHWYESGKLLNKKNSFNDFIDSSIFLIDKGFTSPKKLYAYGGSAGGLLIGAVINMSPELYNGVIAAVPFVDVISTMMDDEIPLTTSEYDEWGNPKNKNYYKYILSYSPYDQIKHQNYPNILVTTGLYDSQVQYWEPAKWVAKIRSMKTDHNALFLITNMKTGHSGASGRFNYLKDLAKEYAFFLDLEEKID